MKLAGLRLSPLLADALGKCRPHIVAAGAFSVLISLLLLTPAIYMLQVYDRVLATGGKATLLFITLGLAVALVTFAALDMVRSRLLIRAGAQIESSLSPALLGRMLSSGTRENVQAMRDLEVVRQTISSPATAALFDLPWAPIFVLVCFLLHPWLGALGLASIALLLAIARWHQRLTREAIDASSRAIATSHLAQQAAAVHAGTIRSLGMVGAMVARHQAQKGACVENLTGAQFAGTRFTAASRFVRLFAQSAALGLGALLALGGAISAGAVIAASILIGRALQPIDALVGGWSSLMTGRAALARLSETTAGEAQRFPSRTALPEPRGNIDVEQIVVKGKGPEPVLGGVSFSISAGEFVGLIGPSGAGKTTLAKVLVGALSSDHGCVRLDGARLTDWEQDQLGRHIGYLPQEASLLEGTIKENICRFRSVVEAGEKLDAEVVAAAQLAGCHEIILRMPQAYETKLGPGGEGLSAGQSQRVALARALFRDPAFLVLDEPNAFLDAGGEEALGQAIESARQRKATILVVAHRKSVLQNASRLLLLENGRLRQLRATNDVVIHPAASAGKA